VLLFGSALTDITDEPMRSIQMDCQTAKSGLFIDPQADNGLENGANRGGMDETIAHVAGLGKVVPHLYDPSDLELQALSARAAADLEDMNK
jgi:hypothetical protein